MSDSPTMVKNLFAELRRRKVVRVAIVYAIVAWLLIQVAGQTFEPLGLPRWALTFVIVLAALGLPLALVLAWAFDIGPGGIERTGPVAPQPGTHGNPTLSAVMAPSDARPSVASQSVAILPFVDMSAERDQDYFCDGIA